MRLLAHRVRAKLFLGGLILAFFAGGYLMAFGNRAMGQVETAPSAPPQFVWVNEGRFDGHLALASSPAAAFSPDSSTLALVSGQKVVLIKLAQQSFEKAFEPQVPGLVREKIDSANFVSPDVLFLLGTGVIKSGHGRETTPLLGFRWNAQQGAMVGKVATIGAQGGAGPIEYLPQIGYLAIYTNSAFELWDPVTGRTMQTSIPELTRRPNIFTFSRDGHWLIVAQIEGGGSNDPVVVQLSTHQMVNSLRGHQGAVMSVEFSPDSKKAVTACDDGKVRIYSVPDWSLLETLTGHQGPVHWAEFSPDGTLVASASEDQTVRLWSVADGKLLQTLSESQQPLRTVAFSPDGQHIAATSQDSVLDWQRTPTGN